MSMINRLAVKAEIAAFGMRTKAADIKTKIGEKVHNKKIGSQEVVVALVLVVVAVALCIVFKTTATSMINTTGTKVTESVGKLVDDARTTTP